MGHVRAALGFAAAVLVMAGAAAPSAAVPTGSGAGVSAVEAQREAEQAARDVEKISGDLRELLEAEETALLGVGSGVQAAVQADDARRSAGVEAARARARQARTVRALYSSGGELAVYASVLESGSVEEMLERGMVVRRLLARAADDSRQAGTAAAAARQDARDADAQVEADVATAADVSEAATRVEATLATARARLASLTAEASRLAAAQEARRRWEDTERAVAAGRATSAASAAQRVTAVGIPEDYQGWYVKAAATCPGLRWTLLAAVGQVESRHGRNNGPSSSGAVGPMQFMPKTFTAYGVDGDGDGTADPWAPADAIFSAARYLCANGVGTGTPEAERRALLRYNNAGWYVDLVLGVEADLVARRP